MFDSCPLLKSLAPRIVPDQFHTHTCVKGMDEFVFLFLWHIVTRISIDILDFFFKNMWASLICEEYTTTYISCQYFTFPYHLI